MGWLEAIVLGIVQGLTEFLPISSSAHQLIVGQLLFGGRDPGAAFTAVTQLGTETAVLIYFWKDIVRIVKHWALSLVGRIPRSDPDARMGWFVIVGSIPIGVLGLLFQDAIDSTLRNLWITVGTLGGVGLLLGLADGWPASTRRRSSSTSPGATPSSTAWRRRPLIRRLTFRRHHLRRPVHGLLRPAATRYAFLLAIRRSSRPDCTS